MLNLASESDPSWIEHALAHLDDVLLDHAQCEKKAAGTCVRLLFRYSHHQFLLEPLSRLAREELEHYELVLARLASRGVAYRTPRPSPYAGQLRGLIRSHEPARLIDTLLCSAVIEARSCERFKLLGDAIPEPGLAAFYRDLLAAEARHHHVYLELAAQLGDAAEVRERLLALARGEAEILEGAPPAARIHS